MVFSSLIFLCIFLPSVLILYHAGKNQTYRNAVLVFASLFFYAWGEPVYIIMLVFNSLFTYFTGLITDRHRGQPISKVVFILSVVVNLSLLGLFKYSGFIVDNFNLVTGMTLPFQAFALPLGISFFTFQTMSYSIDVYKGNVKVQKSLLKYMVYVTMFPQLVAGPIVRYIDIEDQIDDRQVSLADFESGVLRFVRGMFKKVVLANSAGKVVSLLLDSDLSGLSAVGAWFGILMYAFQIYFDFAGYADMAIGLGRFFGFDFPENFDYPYISGSATEFWRRWHITLGTFFREYVYIPLGGNRSHHLRNILAVWALTGLWHGASWNFILWGLFYGIILIIEKKAFGGKLLKLPPVIRNLYSSVITLIGWSLFYFTDFSRLKAFFKAAVGLNNGVILDAVTKSEILSNLFLVILLFFCSTPLFERTATLTRQRLPYVYSIAKPIFVIAIMALSFVLLVGQTYNPFLYFRF